MTDGDWPRIWLTAATSHSESTATVLCTCNKLLQIKSKCKIISITVTTNSLHVHLRMQCIIDYRSELQVVITSYSIRLKHTTPVASIPLKNVVTWAQLPTSPVPLTFFNFFLIVFRQYTVTRVSTAKHDWWLSRVNNIWSLMYTAGAAEGVESGEGLAFPIRLWGLWSVVGLQRGPGRSPAANDFVAFWACKTTLGALKI